jgi:hypothetical protein
MSIAISVYVDFKTSVFAECGARCIGVAHIADAGRCRVG